jgi:hypothetical protein
MNDYDPAAQAPKNEPKKGMKIRTIFALLFFAFIGGAILSVWAADRLNWFGTDSAPPQTNATAISTPAFSSNSASVTPAIGPMTDRVEDLEARLSRINSETATATGNAARAEGMLVTYAARRAIESGEVLGYVENQLRTHFSAEQPRAVEYIVRSARNPVTLDLLRAELESQGSYWLVPSGLSAWARFKQELNGLFVLRRADSPSPVPARKLLRAQQYAETGNIKSALAEIENLPGKIQAQEWMDKAKTYIEVRNALDIIERTALARPAPAPAATPEALGAAPAPANTSDKIPIDNQNDYTISD